MVTVMFAIILASLVAGVTTDKKSEDIKFVTKCYETTENEKCFNELRKVENAIKRKYSNQ